VLLIAALLLNWLDAPEDPDVQTPVSEQSEATEQAATDDTAEPPPAEPQPDSATDTDVTSTDTVATGDGTVVPETEDADETVPSDAPPPVAPTFDVVRIDPNGDTVMAGRAEPNASVTVLDGGAPLGVVDADPRGEWVYLPTAPLSPGPHELTLRSELVDGRVIMGTGTVVLVVPDPGKDVAGREVDADDAEARQPMVLLIPDAEQPGAEVLQSPPTDGAEGRAALSPTTTAEPDGVQSADGTLSVETIDYDAEGNLSISGSGPADAVVMAYLDNDLLGFTAVRDADQSWRLTPDKEVAPGVYTMRLDALRDNAVIARLEIPFSRAAPFDDLNADAFIIVQPGNSLWRIARRTLGTGFSYTVIYDANADQIRDPDLIYPGQVFEIPRQ
jgi:nucleoid-associated protein YgaU